jgi:protein-disulfide isomerase
MQITMPLRRTLAAGLLPFLLGLPLPSAAAAPSAQNVLNTALLRQVNGQAQRTDVSLKVNVVQTAYKKTDPSGKADLSIHLQSRTVPRAGAPVGDQEGKLSLDSLSIDPSLTEDMPVTLDGPLSFQWKLVDKTAYFQISQVPPSLLEMAKDFGGMDYSVLVGRWMKFDLGDANPTVTMDEAKLASLKALALKAPPLLVTRIESKTKDAQGHDLWRLRLRVNPTFLSGVYNLAYKELPKSPASARAAALKQLNTEYANARLQISRTGMVAMVDVQTQKLVRYEIGGKYPTPVKSCTYNARLQQICTTTGLRTVTIALGINLSSDDGSPVIAPADALDEAGIEALLGGSDLQTNDININDEQTLVAPGNAPEAVDPSADHILGNANAEVTVIVYEDFACPFCQRMEPDVKRLLADFPQDVRLVYRQFPLASIHPTAQSAAEASECAANLGGNNAFWQMHDKLMSNPALQNRDGYLAFAGQIGLDGTAFAACIDGHTTAARIQRDITGGNAAGIQGTPTTFVNGTKIEGAVTYAILQNAVVSAGGIH